MGVKIKEPFNEQYTLWIISDMMGVNVKMTSKTQIRWDFTVSNITEETLEVKLLLLDHKLLEYNNPYIEEIARLTQTFARMYNELHMVITHKGEVKNVLNMNLIQAKWEQTKIELEKIAGANPDLKKIIQLNDSIFLNPGKLTESIQASEFFAIYFNYIFGNKLPFLKKDISKPNFFNTANVLWSFKVEQTSPSVEINTITVKGEPTIPLSIGFYNKAYAQFSNQIDITKLTTNLEESGEYEVENKSGRLIQAQLKRNEIADEKELFTKVTYQMMCNKVFEERIKKNKEIEQQKQIVEEESKYFSKYNYYKEHKGKKYTKEEWDKFEQIQFEEYAKKNNLKIETERNKNYQKRSGFFLDEKDQ